MRGQNFINNTWVEGLGEKFISKNPATGETVWVGCCASKNQINEAIEAAHGAFSLWSMLSVEERITFLQKFCQKVGKEAKALAEIISKEVGKPLWESETEVNAMIHKLPISIEAYYDRCKEITKEISSGSLVVRHRPQGVVAVLGPFNFPLHLPMGHIIPALLAGNTVIFKPSELTPLVAEKIFEYWLETSPPTGVMNLIQGTGETGSLLVKHPGLEGLFFTGSFKTGQGIAKIFSEEPRKILALEMGGNNPLVVHEVNHIKAAVYHTIQSAYITSGQRCTCARRLIVTRGQKGENFVSALIKAIQTLQVGPYTDQPEPFMGPQVSNLASDRIIAAYETLVRSGATPLVPLKRIQPTLPFLSPSLLDVTSVINRPDEEIFGPLLQLIWVDDFEGALIEANKTAYGLAAGLLSEEESLYGQFLNTVRAGIINWNKPLTGASSQAPFGGIGQSGNHRPSAYYAADYCAYPVASIEDRELTVPKVLPPGIQL